jgi:hydrogenase/urease accessory protein HupE
MRFSRFALVTLLACSSAAHAHQGADHDGGVAGLLHYLTQPDHVLTMSLLLIGGLGAGIAAGFAVPRLARRWIGRRGK